MTVTNIMSPFRIIQKGLFLTLENDLIKFIESPKLTFNNNHPTSCLKIT